MRRQILIVIVILMVGAGFFTGLYVLNRASGAQQTTAASSIQQSTSTYLTTSLAQTQGYNSSSSSNSTYAAALAACTKAGVSASNCPAYCQSNPSACGLSGSPQANSSRSTVPYNNSFIVFNPVNLSQILNITKFRSCQGHEFGGFDVNGTSEPNSSMKHYFRVTSTFRSTYNKIQIFAPFNGYVVSLYKLPDLGLNYALILSANNGGNWKFTVFHMNAFSAIQNGSKVVAGQLLGFANLSSGLSTNFDISLSKTQGTNFGRSGTYDSIFYHMSPSVYAQYVARGVNLSNIIVPLVYRQSHPCVCDNSGACYFVPSSNGANDSVKLTWVQPAKK